MATCTMPSNPAAKWRMRVRQNRVVLAVVATVKFSRRCVRAQPGRQHHPIREAREARRKVRLPGEHGISRPTIAQGRPSDWLHLYAAVRFSCVCFSRSGPRVPAGTRPSLRPLGQGGRSDQAKLGRNAPRVREGVSTIQDASWKSGATASYSVTASAAKQSSLPPRRDSGLLRSARKDALRECAPHATLASPVRSAEALQRVGGTRGG
jgi:hypothetical protein